MHAELSDQHKKALAVGGKMKEDLRLLENKIQDARRRREILIARKYRAQAQKKMLDTSDQLNLMSNRADAILDRGMTDASLTLCSLEDSVSDMEAEVEARQELMDDADDVEKSLRETERRERVEQELEKLKQSLKTEA